MNSGERPALQGRSREKRDLIVDALDAALKEKPFDQVSISEIAKRAGVAVGTVYQRFKNKEAFVPVILSIYRAHIETWMAKDGRIELQPTDDLRSALRKVFRRSWTLCKRESHLLRAVHIHVRLKPDLADNDEWRAYEEASAAGVRAIIDHFATEVKRGPVDRSAAFATYFFNTIMIEKGLYPEESPAIFFKPNNHVFADEAAEMLYAYLTTSVSDKK